MIKSIATALLLSTSISTYAGNYLIEAECKGTYENGVELVVNMHLPEAYYCDDGESGNTFQGVLVTNSPVSGQEVYTGIVTESDDASAEYTTSIGFSQNVPEEGTMTLSTTLNYSDETGEFKMSFESINGEKEDEILKLTCNRYHYQMDC